VGNAITFDDVLLVPAFNPHSSRKDVDISMRDQTGKLMLDLPVMTSNMDTITEHEMANFIGSKGGMGVLHRFMSIEDNVLMLEKCKYKTFVSVGCSASEMERVVALKDAGAYYFCVDVAHGHAEYVGRMIKNMRELFSSNACIMAGNVATREGAEYLADAGADIIKVGIGPGCFAAGTRVLMGDGVYKNIEDIQVGEKVVNMFGQPVEVKRAFSTGYRKICRYRHSHSHKFTYATPDHSHYVGDCNSVSEETLKSAGYRDVLSKETKKEESKFKWKELNDLKQDVLLFPEKVNFDIPDDFQIDLESLSERSLSLESFKCSTVSASYDLGYLFGAYLGDGSSRILDNGSGAIHFYFNATEGDIALKTQKALMNVFGYDAGSSESENVIKITAYSIVLAKLFVDFGKKQEKHLPKKYMVKNEPYLLGIYDGLIDSDGHYGADGRVGFTNTSEEVTELFNVVSILLGKGHPQYLESQLHSSEMVTAKKWAYKSRLLMRPDRRRVGGFLISKVFDKEVFDLDVRVYDLEVGCDTHSFIANGAIVHNSVCTTRIKTGYGVPQLTAIQDCAKVDRSIVADGGIKTAGDVVKALAFGADFVMLGGMLAGTAPTPGRVEFEPARLWSVEAQMLSHIVPREHIPCDGGVLKFKVYRGMASKEVADDYHGGLAEWKTAEGVSTRVPYREDQDAIIADIVGGLRSGLTYGGAKNILALQSSLNYVTVTPAGRTESLPHKTL